MRLPKLKRILTDPDEFLSNDQLRYLSMELLELIPMEGIEGSLRANLEHSLKEAVYSLLSWIRDNDDRGVDDLMEETDHLFVHSTADPNVQS